MAEQRKPTHIRDAGDVTPELMGIADAVAEGFPGYYLAICGDRKHIDSADVEAFLEILEASELEDGTYPDFGVDAQSSAVRKIFRHVGFCWG